MRYKLNIEYDGTDFKGWQVQPDARTVEGELEKAIHTVLQYEYDLIGQGRTDAGVHAVKQTAHIDLPDDADTDALQLSINRMTGDDVFVRKIERVHDEFHARFDAKSRSYEYTFIRKPSPLKSRYTEVLPAKCTIPLMMEAAEIFKGEYDFKNFSKFNEDNYTTICKVFEAEMLQLDDQFIFRIRANRFLRNMVRRIAGTLVDVGQGKMSVEDVKDLLNNMDSRVDASKTASAKALKLVNVSY